jgi:hypothetical protein
MSRHLHGLRWAVRVALVLGVAASVAANVLHARSNPVSEVIAAWPSVALLVTVEMVTRVPVHRRWLANIRIAATIAISLIAGWVSYWHMVGVAARYGETGISPYLLPFSVDGLIVVASISLVELTARIRSLATETQPPVTVHVGPSTKEDVTPAHPIAPLPPVLLTRPEVAV